MKSVWQHRKYLNEHSYEITATYKDCIHENSPQQRKSIEYSLILKSVSELVSQIIKQSGIQNIF